MKTILLIEENPDILENLSIYLGLEGYKILAAKDGKKGIELAIEFIPDLIICDFQMPKIDGKEVLSLLLLAAKTFVTPFIFSSSRAEKTDRAEAFRLGADDYITKPFEAGALMKMVKLWITSASSGHRDALEHSAA